MSRVRQAGPKAWKRSLSEWKRRKTVTDFYQNGTITTLHNLGERSTIDLEQDLFRPVRTALNQAMAAAVLYVALEPENV
tara:strand:+ start:381 stop:617 length:237 start_codon:yes stop_codon:yes gene_type:complete